MADPSERLSQLALSHASFLSSREKIYLTDMLGGARRVLGLSLKDMAGLLGRRRHLQGALQPADHRAVALRDAQRRT